MKKFTRRTAALLCTCVLVAETFGSTYASEILTQGTETVETGTIEEESEIEVTATETEETAETEEATTETEETTQATETEATEEVTETTEDTEVTETTEEVTETTEETETEEMTEVTELTETTEEVTESIAETTESTEEFNEDLNDPDYLKILEREENGEVSSDIKYATGIIHNSKFKNYKKIDGIDVSKWQGDIDWSSVKDDGMKFAIVRLGYRGSANGTLMTDNYFEANIKGAKKAGLGVGIYFFTQAITTSEAEEEAEYVIEKLSSYNGYVSWPIYIDMETLSNSRLDNAGLTSDQKTKICAAFCKKIEEAGYSAGVYSNGWYLNTQMDAESLAANYDIWLANYTTQTSYSGTYNMWQYSSTGSVSGISGNVDMNVAYVPTKPEKPSGLSQTASTTDSITLSWTSVTNADGYRVYCYDTDGNEVASKKVTTNSYTFKNLDTGTKYTCRVKAYWTESDDSLTYGSKSDAYEVYTTPGQVKNLTATSQKVSSISLSWKKLKGATAYQVYQYDESAGKYVKIADEITKTTYKAIDLTAGTSYKFKVRGYNKINSNKKNYGKYSAVLTVYTAPEQVKKATFVEAGSDYISLSWKKQSDVSGYRVYQYDTKGNLLKKYDTTKNKYSCTSVIAGTTYRYQVRSFIEQSDGTKLLGEFSDTLELKTAPGKTTKLSQSAASTSSATITWKKVTGTQKYRVYLYDENTKKYKKAADTTATSYKLTGLTAGKKYKVRVRAYNKNGSVTQWGENSTTLIVAVKPDKAKKLTQKSATEDSITVSFGKVKNADSYRIYLYDADGKQIKKADTTKTTYTFKKLTSGTYQFAVKACAKSDSYTAWGACTQKVSINTKPGKVEALKQTKASVDTATISWSKVSGAKGYGVYLYNEAKGKYEKAATTSSTTYKLKKLTTGTTYKVRVRAYLKNGKTTVWGSYTTLKVVTKPGMVKKLKQSAVTEDSITVSWKKVNNVDGYKIYCYDADGTLVKSKKTTDTEETFEKLSAGTYTFKVRAYKKAGSYTAYGAMSEVIESSIE